MASDDGCRGESEALRLKLEAMGAIFAASVSGVGIPLIGRRRLLLRPGGTGFAAVKAFAAGVILSTGFVHMIPNAAKSIADAAILPEFPFSGFAAMLAALGTLFIDVVGTRFYEKKHSMVEEKGKMKMKEKEKEVRVGIGSSEVSGEGRDEAMHIIGIHAHVAAHGNWKGDKDLSHVRHIVVSQVLELGIVSHSIIIGLSLGVSKSSCVITPLMAALSCHQFFEGFALGGCVSQAKFGSLREIVMAIFFAIATPGGIGLGIAVASTYDPGSPSGMLTDGILDSISAGILIYMALVGLIADDFVGHQKTSSSRLQLACYVSVFMGAMFMSSLALWV
ncbi:zinc transporter 4, chloroplastic-like isoform X2 [Typha latifolia]|uniref:zinc transporter 4, chloroplastic-like isoform X2 n=1 Tax=Typha latifolia TaxID=4733 RepID=UPI003C2B9470